MASFDLYRSGLHLQTGIDSNATWQAETHLPVPVIEEYMTLAQVKEQLHHLEGAVIMWSCQIKELLTSSAETLFDGDEHPGPLAHLKFWEVTY